MESEFLQKERKGASDIFALVLVYKNTRWNIVLVLNESHVHFSPFSTLSQLLNPYVLHKNGSHMDRPMQNV